MKVLYLHLAGGTNVAFPMPEEQARHLVDVIRTRWVRPDPEDLDIGLGAGDEITTWLLYSHITGIELHDAQVEQEQDEETP